MSFFASETPVSDETPRKFIPAKLGNFNCRQSGILIVVVHRQDAGAPTRVRASAGAGRGRRTEPLPDQGTRDRNSEYPAPPGTAGIPVGAPRCPQSGDRGSECQTALVSCGERGHLRTFGRNCARGDFLGPFGRDTALLVRGRQWQNNVKCGDLTPNFHLPEAENTNRFCYGGPWACVNSED